MSIGKNLDKTEYDYDALFICPPYLTQDPPLAFFREESFKFQIINPGILSIASYLTSKGFSVKILDTSINNDFRKIKKELQNNTPKIIGISNNTGFDYVESLRCLDVAKENSSQSLTLMGGEHCSRLGSLVFEETNNLDGLVVGEGEIALEQVLTNKKKNFKNIKGLIFKKENGNLHLASESSERLLRLPKLDYSLYPNVTQFTPYVEESRGCPKKCKFCPNEALYQSRVKFKSLNTLSEELDQVMELWGHEKILALLTSNFGINSSKTLEQIKILREKNLKWSTQTSVDSNWKTFLPAAYDAGLRVLTVGLESGSEEILKRMNKTSGTKQYIKRAEKLVRTASEFPNLTTKINFIFYIGETPTTLKRTLDFLMKNDKYIDTIIYTPLFITPGSEIFNNFEKYSKSYGAELVTDRYWSKRHLSPCNPSKDFKYKEVVFYCRMIESIFSDKTATIKAESHHYSVKDREDLLKEIK